jgi:phosphoserine phosphatase
MVSGTDTRMINQVDSVLDIKRVVDNQLETGDHTVSDRDGRAYFKGNSKQHEVKDQLEDLGYM